jgi:rhamnosyltransferase
LSRLEKIPGVHLICNSQNRGIAAALNTGIRHAVAANYSWVATFDQDSTVTPDFFKSMLAAYEVCPFKEKVALISPVHCVSKAEWHKKKSADFSRPFVLTRAVMTSGSLIKTGAFAEVGWYDESMFIDYVDFDFCLRLGQRGYQIIRSCRSCLLHNLGSLEVHYVFGWRTTIKSHNASRRYYIMRNRINLYRRYARTFPFWFLQDFFWLLLDFTKILLFEQNKRAKLRNAFKGIRHGLAGISGPLVTADASLP